MGFLLTCDYANYRRNARLRGHSFEITFEEYLSLVKSDCYICGAEPSRILKRSGKSVTDVVNGIDRVDNTLGYTKGNVRPCCSECNMVKGTWTLGALKAHLKKMIRGIHE